MVAKTERKRNIDQDLKDSKRKRDLKSNKPTQVPTLISSSGLPIERTSSLQQKSNFLSLFFTGGGKKKKQEF